MSEVLAGVGRWSPRWLAAAALVAVAVLVVVAPARAATSASFAPYVDYPIDNSQVQYGPAGPEAVAVADFDGDGHLDLAAPSFTPQSTVSVRRGRGDGTFGERADYAVGRSYATDVEVGDFNRDGKPDLVVTAQYGPAQTGSQRAVSVLLGRGDGTFAPYVEYATGPGPSQVRVGDLNGDGNPDLATANLGNNTVSVLLGLGDGSFATNSDYPTGGGPNDLALGDLNRDGSPDVVTADGDGNVSVLLGNPNGTLAPRTDYAAGLGKPNIRYARPYGVAVSDLNGDRSPDVGVVTYSVDDGEFNSVSVLLGRGDGTLAPMVAYEAPNYASGGPKKVAVGDFNGDGHPDLTAADNVGVSVLPNNGDGTFSPRTEYPAHGNAKDVAVGDFNEDGRPDLATANNTSTTVNRPNGSVSVLLNTTPAVTPGGGASPPPAGGGAVSPPSGAVPDTLAPGVSGLGLTNNPFVVGGSTPTFGVAAKAKTRHKKGTTFQYTLSEAATVRIVITQARSGRRRGKRCVAPTRKLRKAKKCTRVSVKGTLTRTSHQGSNRVAFSGRIGSTALAPGRYQATLTATDPAKNSSTPKTIAFTIVRR